MGGAGAGRLRARDTLLGCTKHLYLCARVPRTAWRHHTPWVGARAGGAAGPAAGLAAAACDSSHPVDVAAALEAAMVAAEGGQLAWTLPWVTRYLWFLRWDSEAARAPYFR